MKDRIKNWLEDLKEFTTLKQTIKILQKEVEESKKREQPYIDMIQKLKSENRTYKIQNTRLKNENAKLKYEISELKSKQDKFFEE